MRYRIIIADENHARIAQQGFTRIIERFGESRTPITLAHAEGILRRAGAIPDGYRVAMVKEETP